MIVKYGDAEDINIIQPLDITDEDTKQKLEDLKGEMNKDSSVQVNQEQK